MASSSSYLSEERKEGEKYPADPDITCGFRIECRPKWLQPLGNPGVYLVLLSITGLVSETYSAYQAGVMSTLQQRFDFRTETTWIITGIDKITPVLLGALVGYFGGRTHRPRVLGLGAFLLALGCFISALPYFIYGPASYFEDLNGTTWKNGSELELCDGSVLEKCVAEDPPPTSVVVGLWTAAGILKGFGTLAYYAMGLSYMDDNAKKRDSPMYFTVAVGLLLVGPSLGVLLSSICLKYFENPFDDPGYGPDDPCWVGAWWIGFVVQGLLVLLVTIPIFMFPKSLPGYKKPVDRSTGTNTTSSFSGISVAVKRIVLNPLLWAILMDGVVSTYWTIGHKVVLPRYMEDQFRLTPSEASYYSDIPGTGAVLLGASLGGVVIWKIRPPMKALLGAMIVLKSLAGCGYLALMEPKCDKIQMANFGMENGSLILDGSCNMNCNCTRKSFTPVCGSDLRTVYFSPCYAGCEQSFNETFFNNCSCIVEPSSLESYTTEGFCPSETCWIQALAYIIASPIIQFLMNILIVMQLLMLLRCTLPQDKSLALGLYVALKSIPGIIPALILLGPMLDPACLIWEHSSDKSGTCWFYDTDKFSKALHGTSAGFSFLSAGTLGLVFGLRGRFRDLYAEDIGYEELPGETHAKETQSAEIDRSHSIQDSDDSYEAIPKMSLDRVISCRICLKLVCLVRDPLMNLRLVRQAQHTYMTDAAIYRHLRNLDMSLKESLEAKKYESC